MEAGESQHGTRIQFARANSIVGIVVLQMTGGEVMAKKFDAIIIGTGQSGPALAQRMTRQGMKRAIIERKLFGGTCVNVGCIPTKTLVASARAAYVARRGAVFGVAIDGSIAVDLKRVKARMDGVVRQSNEGVTN